MELTTEKVLVDSAAWKALVDDSDEFHEEAKRIFKEIQSAGLELVTTNFVLDESYTLLRVRCGREHAYLLRDAIGNARGEIIVIRVRVVDELGAWKWFEKDWSRLSFTDCVTFAVMERLRIRKVFTFDRHFRRAGFEMVGF